MAEKVLTANKMLPYKQSTVTVGVLCMDMAENLAMYYERRYVSYISAAYVKFLESCGSLVVPIWIGKERAYYEQIMDKVNGILFPGGSVFIVKDQMNPMNPMNPLHTNECVNSSKIIYELAKEKNINGQYFPLWGTCLGFELLVVHDVGHSELLKSIEIRKKQTNINFVYDFKKSRMFREVSTALENVMITEPFAQFYHRHCITVKDFMNNPYLSRWKIIAKDGYDINMEYVTIAEHRDYPFYGVQFHPERVAHERFNMIDNPITTPDTILASSYFAHFFINECRKNNNAFVDKNDLLLHLIHNFKAEFTGRHLTSRYLQCYLFEANPEYKFQDSQ